MKRILKFFLGALIASASIGAHAQTETLGSQVKTGAGQSVNLSRVLYVRTTPGNQYIIDNAGRQFPITLVSITQVTSTLAWREFIEVSPGLFANGAEATRIYCDAQRGTFIEWVGKTPELLPDGCVAAYRAESFSRAR